MLKSVKIERHKDYESTVLIDSLCEAAPATNKYLQKSIHYMMLVGTHVPEPDQLRLGALVALLLRDQNVLNIELRQRDGGDWIADAFVRFGRRERLKRGEGTNPIEAFVNLVYDIQRS